MSTGFEAGWDPPACSSLVLVVVVPLVADRVAEAEGEDDAQELHGDHADDDADDDVEAADQVVVHSLVAALETNKVIGYWRKHWPV